MLQLSLSVLNVTSRVSNFETGTLQKVQHFRKTPSTCVIKVYRTSNIVRSKTENSAQE